MIAGNYAREISISADGVTVGLSELQAKFDLRASSLRDQYKQEAQMASPSFDGVMFDLSWDESIKPLKFGTGFMDNYLAGRQNYGDYDPSERPGLDDSHRGTDGRAGLPHRQGRPRRHLRALLQAEAEGRQGRQPRGIELAHEP